jgi:hypothetical protein
MNACATEIFMQNLCSKSVRKALAKLNNQGVIVWAFLAEPDTTRIIADYAPNFFSVELEFVMTVMVFNVNRHQLGKFYAA